ncbi:hypothetical protein NLJ89_g10023 [Agrocybe chaxingu]|uniref:Uncharacterized protein n=1 Tax=Agrocybe chaxingu TaxID=84603 RepID=A0A9W8JSG4_9AGAR|nr:hypothetical protein NLJ89_g10023 [Agrocybe chaxingu]
MNQSTRTSEQQVALDRDGFLLLDAQFSHDTFSLEEHGFCLSKDNRGDDHHINNGASSSRSETREETLPLNDVLVKVNLLNHVSNLGCLSPLLTSSSQILKAASDSVICPMLQESCLSVFVLGSCGHTFSAQALHGLFQAAIRDELSLQRHNCLGAFRKPGESPIYNEAELEVFKHLSTAPFLPLYRCPVCRARVTHPPVQSRKHMKLVSDILEIMTAHGIGHDVEDGNADGDVNVEWQAYFIF